MDTKQIICGLLVVVVIATVFYFYNKNGNNHTNSPLVEPPLMDEPVAAEKPAEDPKTNNKPENETMKNNVEYFAACNNPAAVQSTIDCLCATGDENVYANHDYGVPGDDWATFLRKTGVSDDVVANHSLFVKDRAGIVGRTFSPDSHDSYDPIPWHGLRRPQYVEQCNPTQIPDINTDLYAKGNRQYCIKTT